MTDYYLGAGDVARLIGVSPDTVRGYIAKDMLPTPDVVITNGESKVRGWTREKILEWHEARPGRGWRRGAPDAGQRLT